MTTPMQNRSSILISDDDPTARRLMQNLLAGEGYDLSFAEDGPAALAAARAIDPDLILLDLEMPGLSGLEVTRELRRDTDLSGVPIVMITGLDQPEVRLQAINAGVDDFVCKPFERTELRARVRTITRLNRHRKLKDAYHRLHESYDATLRGWVHALDLRDKETEGHSLRVTELTMALAVAVGVPEADLPDLRKGALLHDIGKLGIPDAILHKPGSLTPEEMAVMRRHPVYARDMLADIPYLRGAIAVPYHHHERWDGTGYPCGLSGDSIPLAARLFAVVDVWDALTSDRPYRPAWPPQKALDHIRAGVGSHFDPAVVEAFLRLPAVRGRLAAGRPVNPTVLPTTLPQIAGCGSVASSG